MTTFATLDAAVATGSGSHTRIRVLRAAVDLFSEQGFEATTMRQLAEAANVSAPALYNHFANKEALLIAAVEWMMRTFAAEVTPKRIPVSGGPEAVAELENVVRTHVRHQITFQSRTRAFYRIVNGPIVTSLPPDIRQRIRDNECRYVDTVTELVRLARPRAGQDDRDVASPRVMALAISSVCSQIHTWYNPDGPFTPEQVADQVWAISRRIIGLD